MNKAAVRRATLNDIEQIAFLFDQYRQFYEQAADLMLAKQFLSDRLNKNESIIFIAEDAQQNPLGFCQLYPTFCSVIAKPIIILSDLFVLPSARKMGVGKALMDCTNDYATANQFARTDLTTAKNNYTAQSLYESQGWTRDEVYYAYNKAIDLK